MKLFKTYSEKEVKRVMPIVNKINSLEEEMTKLTDKELREKTEYFKKQLEEGKTLDDATITGGIDWYFKTVEVVEQGEANESKEKNSGNYNWTGIDIRNYHHTVYRNHGKEFHDG